MQVVFAGKAQNPALPHVLLVLDQFPRTLGGGERIVLRLAALLPSFGFRVSILTFQIHAEVSTLEKAGCPIYLLPLTRVYDWQALKAALTLRRFLKEQRVTIVQTFFESSDLWAGLVVTLFSHARLVWSRRDMGILRARKHRIAYRWMRRAPAMVFAVSEQVRRYTIEVDGVDPGRVQTIYNGLDLPENARPHPPPRPAGDFLITSMGNIRSVKGHDLFIEAAALVLKRFPSARFEIAGEVLEPDFFATLQARVQALGLAENVHFVGGVANPGEYLRSADLFVLPSRSEGFSNAIVEAMAVALPVVATEVGGNAEAVEDGVCGCIVPPENPTALANAIMSLLADPPRMQQMGLAARARVQQQFTTSAMMTRIVNCFQKIILN